MIAFLRHAPRKRRLAAALLAALTPALGAEEPLDLRKLFSDGIPKSPFIAAVYAFAADMLEHGHDRAGPHATPLFLGALDRDARAPLVGRPAAPPGVVEAFRPGGAAGPLCGANLLADQNFFRTLYFLGELTGKAHYTAAADEALKWFLDNAQAPSGHFYWGRGASWDALADAPAVSGAEPWHEMSRPWLLWDKCFQLAPAACRRFALALKDDAAPRWTARHAGFAIRAWAEAYAHTREQPFLDAIAAALDAAPAAGAPAARLSFAIDCDGAARKVPEPLRTRLRLHARREDEAFCALGHPLRESLGFRSDAAGAVTALWCAPPAGLTTAGVALLCASRYENGADPRHADLVVAAAEAYMSSSPEESCDAWPMTFGHAVSLELAAFRVTAEDRYFRRAFALGEAAIERFFGGKTLPRASLKSEHYESTTGADSLLLALIDLHLTTLTITAARAPVNSVDR